MEREEEGEREMGGAMGGGEIQINEGRRSPALTLLVMT